MLETVELETGPKPTWTILWLHGLGADGNDFVPIIPELVQPQWPELRFVFPHAPIRPITVNAGMQMRAWYDIRDFNSLTHRADVEGVEASITQVSELITREIERGVPRAQIILAGFSQGGAIALSAGVRCAEPLGGIIALSTYLPLGEASLGQENQQTIKPPIFMAHGQFDPVVPTQLGEQSQAILVTAGFKVEWHTYPIGHEVCLAEIQQLSNWLSTVFS